MKVQRRLTRDRGRVLTMDAEHLGVVPFIDVEVVQRDRQRTAQR